LVTGRRPAFGSIKKRRRKDCDDFSDTSDEEGEVEVVEPAKKSSSLAGSSSSSVCPMQAAASQPNYGIVRDKVQTLLSELECAMADTSLDDLLSEEAALKEELQQANRSLYFIASNVAHFPAFIRTFKLSVTKHKPAQFSLHNSQLEILSELKK